jgi:hypothetical protein
LKYVFARIAGINLFQTSLNGFDAVFEPDFLALQTARLLIQHVTDKSDRLRSAFHEEARGSRSFSQGAGGEDPRHGRRPQC